jgi:hypothetical protein
MNAIEIAIYTGLGISGLMVVVGCTLVGIGHCMKYFERKNLNPPPKTD